MQEESSCDRETAILLDTMFKLSSTAQWKLLYDTGLWKIKAEYALAMLERYGQLSVSEEEISPTNLEQDLSSPPPPQKRMRESLAIRSKCLCKQFTLP